MIDLVEDYLRRAQSKEQLMADYDHASSHPSEVYHDQLQRTREMISRSRENLDYIEEQSAIEVSVFDFYLIVKIKSQEENFIFYIMLEITPDHKISFF